MQEVFVACAIDIDPALKSEAIVRRWGRLLPQLIQETLNMLFHLTAKCSDHRFVEREQIERIMPPTDIGPTRSVLVVVHQSTNEILELCVEVFRPVVALVYPRREQRNHGSFDHHF